MLINASAIKVTLLTLAAIALLSAIAVIALAQTNSFTIGGFTIDASGSPVLTVKPPTRAGTLAIVADIPTAPPSATIAGSATLTAGQVTVTFPAQSAAPVCVAIDTTAASAVRRTAVTNSSVSFEGVTNHLIEYVCAAKNN